ncbi:MAG: cytochrome c [Gammaproteobacteria bacterium]|nr:cytochrome c [Gammaproteobacteria bacterium]MCW8924266.1 cytochrome c [Gammaproteobacteria bacterium]
MKKLFLLITLLAFSSIAQAENDDELYNEGKEAHQTHCTKCHGDEVYTRENRFIKSMEALSKQVERCKENTGVAWFDEDTEAVAHFLNKKYYKF